MINYPALVYNCQICPGTSKCCLDLFGRLNWVWLAVQRSYLGPYQTFRIELTRRDLGLLAVNIFTKCSMIDVWEGLKYAFAAFLRLELFYNFWQIVVGFIGVSFRSICLIFLSALATSPLCISEILYYYGYHSKMIEEFDGNRFSPHLASYCEFPYTQFPLLCLLI